MNAPFLWKRAPQRATHMVNLYELGYRSLYLHTGEKPLIAVFSMGFRSVVEVTDWTRKHLGYKVVWISPHCRGFQYDLHHDIIGTDVFTLHEAIKLRQNQDNIVALLVHMAAPHTGPWKIKNRIKTLKCVCFLYDIMNLWVPKERRHIWDEYDDAKGSNLAEYESLEETLRGDYIEGLLYKDWGENWPLIEKAGVPNAWWPSTLSEKLYQKPPASDSAWDSFCFIGTIMPKRTHDRPSGLFSDIMMEDIFREVALQGFPVHAYVLKPDKDVVLEYRQLFPGGSGVKLFPGDNLTNLLPRIQGRYKWGWMLYHYPEKSIMGLVEASLPTKIFTYMALGLPIVVSEEMTRAAAFVREHQIGVVVSQADIQNLRAVLSQVDHGALVRNILKTRPRFSIEAMTPNLGRVIQEVMEGPRKPIPEKPTWLEIDEQIEKAREKKQKETQEDGAKPQKSGWKHAAGIEGGAGPVYTESGDSTR